MKKLWQFLIVLAVFALSSSLTSCLGEDTVGTEDSSSSEVSQSSEEAVSSEDEISSEEGGSSEDEISSEDEVSSSSEEEFTSIMEEYGTSVIIDGLSMGADLWADGVIASDFPITEVIFAVSDMDGSETEVGVSYYDIPEIYALEGEELYAMTIGMDMPEFELLGAEAEIVNACDGEYILHVTALNSDGGEFYDFITFEVNNGVSCGGGTEGPVGLTEGDVFVLGAQSAVEPSALDLDSRMTFYSSERAAQAPYVDLAYGVGSEGGMIMTPLYAESAGFGDWGGENAGDPLIYDVSDYFLDSDINYLTEFPEFADLDFEAYIESAQVYTGLVLLVVTDMGGVFLVQVNNVEDGDAGTITVISREAVEEAAGKKGAKVVR